MLALAGTGSGNCAACGGGGGSSHPPRLQAGACTSTVFARRLSHGELGTGAVAERRSGSLVSNRV